MHPKLLELGPVTVYTYGVLLAAAYLIGLQSGDWQGPRRVASIRTRVMDLGICIIIAAIVGAKLLLVVVDFVLPGASRLRSSRLRDRAACSTAA